MRAPRATLRLTASGRLAAARLASLRSGLLGRGREFFPEVERLRGTLRPWRHVRTVMRAPRLLADAAGAWLAIIAAEGGPWARDFASPWPAYCAVSSQLLNGRAAAVPLSGLERCPWEPQWTPRRRARPRREAGL